MAKSKATAAKRPARDEFQLEELGEKLSEALAESNELVLQVWGQHEPVRGRIVELNATTRKVHVQGWHQEYKIPFLDIMKVERPAH